MPVVFHIPGPLHIFAEGRDEVRIELSETTVRDALVALWALYPALRDRVENEQNEIRQHINIFVNNEEIRHSVGLATPLRGDEEVWIVPSISGGSDAALNTTRY